MTFKERRNHGNPVYKPSLITFGTFVAFKPSADCLSDFFFRFLYSTTSESSVGVVCLFYTDFMVIYTEIQDSAF